MNLTLMETERYLLDCFKEISDWARDPKAHFIVFIYELRHDIIEEFGGIETWI